MSAVGEWANNPYAGYTDARLADTHAFWMGVYRAAKNPAQRARADRGASLAAAEIRFRAATRDGAALAQAGAK